MKSNIKKQAGFSLIEVLIVIGIIGILAVIATVSYQRSQLQGRDSKRLTDTREVFNALSIYYTNTEEYPPDCSSSGYSGGCDQSSNAVFNFPLDTTADGTFVDFLQPEFLGLVPADPMNGEDYNYFYVTDVEYPAGSGEFYGFIVGARLEHAGNKPNTALPVPAGLEEFYLIGERL